MSVQTKKRFKNLGKTIGIALFALLLFTNIKVALMDDAELASGDISILGIELKLFEGTFANETILKQGPQGHSTCWLFPNGQGTMDWCKKLDMSDCYYSSCH